MKKVADKDKATDHRKFLKSVDEWIRKHNADPSGPKLHCKSDLLKVQETLETQQSTGGQFQAPEMEFVFEEDWDSEDGEFETSKVVEENIFGVNKKGI